LDDIQELVLVTDVHSLFETEGKELNQAPSRECEKYHVHLKVCPLTPPILASPHFESAL